MSATQRSRTSTAKTVLGIMSGTSLDGIDFAACEIHRGRPILVRHWARSFDPALRRRLQSATEGQLNLRETARLHHELGRFYARQAGSLEGLPPLAAIGLHGQTVFHDPNPRHPTTLQLGEPAYLAATLQRPVVANFRAGDIALGGEGAPLATAFHVAAFARRGAHTCVQNLGGIANITSIDSRHTGPPRVLAFDTGPGNLLIDAAASHLSNGKLRYDRDGRIGRGGKIRPDWIVRWLKDPFFRKPPPKSTGRERYGAACFERLNGEIAGGRAHGPDLIATLTELTARSVAMAYARFLPPGMDQVILCGGGAENPFLVERIRVALEPVAPGASVLTCTELGWPAGAVEPAAFAWLAWLRLRGVAGNLASTTGAREPAVLGEITDLRPRSRASRSSGDKPPEAARRAGSAR